MMAVANGFLKSSSRLEGYGLSEQPPDPEKATFENLVDDLLPVLIYCTFPRYYKITTIRSVKPFGATEFMIKRSYSVNIPFDQGIEVQMKSFGVIVL